MKSKLTSLFILLSSSIVFCSYKKWICLLISLIIIVLIICSIPNNNFLDLKNNYLLRIDSLENKEDLIRFTLGYDESKSYEENTLIFQSKYKNKIEKDFFLYLNKCKNLNDIKTVLFVYKNYGELNINKFICYGLFLGTYLILIRFFPFYLNLLDFYFKINAVYLMLLLILTYKDLYYLPGKFKLFNDFYYSSLLSLIAENKKESFKENVKRFCKYNKIYKKVEEDFENGNIGNYKLSKIKMSKISSLFDLYTNDNFIEPVEDKYSWYVILNEYSLYVFALIVVIKGILL